LGSETFAGPLKFTGAALLAAAVYGLALYRAYLHPALVAAMPGAGPWQASGGMARRDFVLMSGSALMGAVGGYVLTRDVSGLLANARLGGGLRGTGARPPEEITPAEDFYVVSKNFTDPEVSDVGWALKVHGLVERPLSLTLDEVKAGPSLSQIVTLECISNNIGGDLIGNGKWTGISVAGLLREAGVKPEAAYFITTAADGYHESIPVAEAMREEVMLAYALNDKPITFKHGFPLRLLYPGHYGMKSTKWIETIELSAEDRPGYWTERGWDREAVIKTRARITFPARASEFTAGPIQVYGVALAGARGVSRVEVSVDNQETWHPAELRPPLSKFAWTLWSFTWMNPEKGFQKVWARAVDGNGMVQDGNEAESFPDGATGYHSVLIKVL
jgi:DMSO/TMAO reductase YedYZ molybdopterin-dependent catalytic subunit